MNKNIIKIKETMMMVIFIKRIIKKIIGKFGYEIAKKSTPSDQQLYDHWFLNTIQNSPSSPYWQYSLLTTFQFDSPYGKLVNHGMFEAEFMFEKTLLAEIKEKNIEGAVVEFGVSSGWRLKHLVDSMKETNLERDVYGFDSFEGLPKPDYAYDAEYWKEGMYAANIDDVKKYLNCIENPHIKLIKGWFSDTFKQEEAKNIKQIAFARIDCDLYHPAVECLNYLKDRLVNNAVLVFDDWEYNLRHGEPKAFYEWLPNSGWEFDFLLLNGAARLYLRARKK
jgi:hypothetical protein